MTENNLLSLIIFAPLAGALINWLIGGRMRSELFSSVVACGSIVVSMIVAFMIAFGIGTPHAGALIDPEGKPILDHLWTWIQVGGFRADFGLGMDELSGIYACFITFVGLLILDKQLDFWPAMELSRKVVTKHWWSVFGLVLLGCVVALAGVLACGVGFFVTLPLAQAATVYAYEDIFGARNPEPAPPAPPVTA